MFAFAGAIATTADASSIVFIKGNNVWLANPDGSGQYQVTTNGTAQFAYSSPSEDNNGVIAAIQDTYFLDRMTQNGQMLSSFQPTPDSNSGTPLMTPFSAVISPDGSKIAYYYDNYGCFEGDCGGRTATEVSNSSQATDPSVYGHALDNTYPAWVTSSRLLGFGGNQSMINLLDVGGLSNYQTWVTCDSDPSCTSTSDPTDSQGVLSPQHDKLVALRLEPDGTHLAFFDVTGDPTSGSPPAPPTFVCESTVDSTLSTPSFSPDGSQLIYSDSQGVWLVHIPTTLNSDGSNCDSITFSSSPIIPGGSQARFGLPDNNPAPRTSGSGGSGGSGGGGTGASGGSGGGGGTGGSGSSGGSGGTGGKHFCHVPNLIGQKLPAARSALSRANCTLGKVSKRHTKHKNKGHVLSESPSAGASRSPGAHVNVVVGK
jgi:uncharacterized membrane protein YgcG